MDSQVGHPMDRPVHRNIQTMDTPPTGILFDWQTTDPFLYLSNRKGQQIGWRNHAPANVNAVPMNYRSYR